MLAPLPHLHRVVLTVLVLALGIVAGVIAGQVWGFSLPVGGLLVGSMVGLGIGFLLVHDFHSAPRPARVTRRH